MIVSPGMNKFQVLRDPRENYHVQIVSSLSTTRQCLCPSVLPKSSLEMVAPAHCSSQKNPKELTVYTRRKKYGKDITVAEIGFNAPVLEVPRGVISFANNSLVKQLFGGRLVLLVPV